jgi:uncharacterized protein YceH (UPF0502 family)
MTEQQPEEQPQPQWRPLPSMQRRILGVLVEKAKTTPNAYPITLNALTTGCNQKSNRDPHMDLKSDQVEAALEDLRQMGAVAEIQGDGRVPKFRHYLYDWLGVDKVELSVMAELLLRGEQTVGELRGRASRMDPIESLEALRAILQTLIEKNLVVALTPEGRGQMVAHNLYTEREMNELRRRYAGGAAMASAPSEPSASAAPPHVSRPAPTAASIPTDVISELRVEVAELRAAVARLREEARQLEELREKVSRLEKQMEEFRQVLE